MRGFKEISDRKIIQIALIAWLIIGVISLILKNFVFASSSLVAIGLGLYGLRLIRKREKN